MIERILRKIIRWLGFTVFLSLTPIFWALIYARFHGLPFTWASVATKGEFFLLTVAISGDAIGEIVGSNAEKAVSKLIVGAILFITLVMSSFGFVDMIGSAKNGMEVIDAEVLYFSIWFLATAIVAGSIGIGLSKDKN